jgi:hypothetical protein
MASLRILRASAVAALRTFHASSTASLYAFRAASLASLNAFRACSLASFWVVTLHFVTMSPIQSSTGRTNPKWTGGELNPRPWDPFRVLPRARRAFVPLNYRPTGRARTTSLLMLFHVAGKRPVVQVWMGCLPFDHLTLTSRFFTLIDRGYLSPPGPVAQTPISEEQLG